MNENNFNKPYDVSTTSTTPINGTNYCSYRLPCGYCRILEKHCPMSYTNTIDPIYNDKICDPPYNLNQVTCKTGES
jgi:hypothetical protein